MIRTLALVALMSTALFASPSPAEAGILSSIAKEIGRFTERVVKEIGRIPGNVEELFSDLKGHTVICGDEVREQNLAQRSYDEALESQINAQDNASRILADHRNLLFDKRQLGSSYTFWKSQTDYLNGRWTDLKCGNYTGAGQGGNSDPCYKDVYPQREKAQQRLDVARRNYGLNLATEYRLSDDEHYLGDNLRKALDISEYQVPKDVKRALRYLVNTKHRLKSLAVDLMKASVDVSFCQRNKNKDFPPRNKCRQIDAYWNNTVVQDWKEVWSAFDTLEEAKVIQTNLETEIRQLSQRFHTLKDLRVELYPSQVQLQDRFDDLNCSWNMRLNDSHKPNPNHDLCVREINIPLSFVNRRMGDLSNMQKDLNDTLGDLNEQLRFYKDWWQDNGEVTEKALALDASMNQYVDSKVDQLLCSRRISH